MWETVWPFVRALLIVGVSWALGGWLRGPLSRVLERYIEPTLRVFLLGVVRPLCLIVALPAALDSVGVSITSIIALMSTVGLAIALSLKDSLSNVASGTILLSTRPFRVGDHVTIAGITGRVRRVRILTTELDADDGRRVNITNDRVLAGPMELHAADGKVRVEIVVRAPRSVLNADLLERLRRASGDDAEVVPLDFDGDHVRIAIRTWAERERANEVRAKLFVGLNGVVPLQGTPNGTGT